MPVPNIHLKAKPPPTHPLQSGSIQRSGSHRNVSTHTHCLAIKSNQVSNLMHTLASQHWILSATWLSHTHPPFIWLNIHSNPWKLYTHLKHASKLLMPTYSILPPRRPPCDPLWLHLQVNPIWFLLTPCSRLTPTSDSIPIPQKHIWGLYVSV